jgi:putative SOS response-associated peptidase YedK
MPAVLAPENWERWLAPDALTEVNRRQLLRPAPEETMDFGPVSRVVGIARTNGPELIQRLPG